MKEKTTRVSLDDTQYQIKRFSPEVGSFILGRILNSGTKALFETMRALGDLASPTGEDSPGPGTGAGVPEPEPTAEEKIRRMATSAFGVMTFEERAMIQRRCLDVCARVENDDVLMPVSNSNGTILDDLQLIMRLELEALVFNFNDFFAEGGLSALLKTPAPRQ